jgi:hypothetical protein
MSVGASLSASAAVVIASAATPVSHKRFSVLTSSFPLRVCIGYPSNTHGVKGFGRMRQHIVPSRQNAQKRGMSSVARIQNSRFSGSPTRTKSLNWYCPTPNTMVLVW